MSHSAHAENGHVHIMPVKTLFTVWGALMVLTVATVGAIQFDFGYRGNLVIAMVVATIKATLVVLYFMHLKYDRRFNLLIFVGSLFFAFLFVTMAMLDSSEYQPDIARREAALSRVK